MRTSKNHYKLSNICKQPNQPLEFKTNLRIVLVEFLSISITLLSCMIWSARLKFLLGNAQHVVWGIFLGLVGTAPAQSLDFLQETGCFHQEISVTFWNPQTLRIIQLQDGFAQKSHSTPDWSAWWFQAVWRLSAVSWDYSHNKVRMTHVEPTTKFAERYAKCTSGRHWMHMIFVINLCEGSAANSYQQGYLQWKIFVIGLCAGSIKIKDTY